MNPTRRDLVFGGLGLPMVGLASLNPPAPQSEPVEKGLLIKGPGVTFHLPVEKEVSHIHADTRRIYDTIGTGFVGEGYTWSLAPNYLQVWLSQSNPGPQWEEGFVYTKQICKSKPLDDWDVKVGGMSFGKLQLSSCEARLRNQHLYYNFVFDRTDEGPVKASDRWDLSRWTYTLFSRA